MGAEQLTVNSILKILKGDEVVNPVVQVLSIKIIAPHPDSNQSRYRLMLSDSKFMHNYSMITAEPETPIMEELTPNTVIRITRYQTCQTNRNANRGGRKVLLVLSYEVLRPANDGNGPIGNPTNVEEYLEKQTTETPSSGMNGGPPVAASRPMEGGGLENPLTFPINSLSPYSNRWVIKARVTAKGPIRTWSNARGEGKLFSMDLKDEGGEIRATAFKAEVDRFYDMIDVDKVYYISKCQLKPANKQYSTLKNDYEMTFTSDTIVQECTDNVSSIPGVQYNFVPISQLGNMEDKTIVDVIGVIKQCGELQVFTARASGKELRKRDITLVDKSNASVNLTLWDEQAANFDPYSQAVVLIKSAIIKEYNGGKTLGLGSNATMKLNPDTSEALQLRTWFDSGAAENITTSVSAGIGGGAGNFTTEWMTFDEAKTLGAGDKADYFQCKAFIHHIRMQNAVYKACPQPECNKKVFEEGGSYRCEKCNQTFPNFKYRYLLSVLTGDWTTNKYISCFNEVAEQLLGKTAQEVGEALENNPTEAEELFAGLNFKSFAFKLRSKLEHYGDTSRNKLTAVNVAPVNYQEYNTHLMKELEQLTGIVQK